MRPNARDKLAQVVQALNVPKVSRKNAREFLSALDARGIKTMNVQNTREWLEGRDYAPKDISAVRALVHAMLTRGLMPMATAVEIDELIRLRRKTR